MRSKAMVERRFLPFFRESAPFLSKLHRPDFRHACRFFEVVLRMIRRLDRHLTIGRLISNMTFKVSERVRNVHVAGRVIRVSRGLLVDSSRGGHRVMIFLITRQIRQRNNHVNAQTSRVNGFTIQITDRVLRNDLTIKSFVRPLCKRSKRRLISDPKVKR